MRTDFNTELYQWQLEHWQQQTKSFLEVIQKEKDEIRLWVATCFYLAAEHNVVRLKQFVLWFDWYPNSVQRQTAESIGREFKFL